MSSTQGKVVIDNLMIMEEIVDRRSDLRWDGWNVIQLFSDDDAMMNKRGMFRNGVWYRTRTFSIENNGWTIPANWVK